jgi:hypothetical protein
MKMLWVTAIAGLSLMGTMDLASAQRGGYGYEERDYGGRGDRGYGRRDYDDDDRGRGRGYREERAYGGFSEREYLRCNPDVRRAVDRGQMESGAAHYKVFGRREGRRLSC